MASSSGSESEDSKNEEAAPPSPTKPYQKPSRAKTPRALEYGDIEQLEAPATKARKSTRPSSKRAAESDKALPSKRRQRQSIHADEADDGTSKLEATKGAGTKTPRSKKSAAAPKAKAECKTKPAPATKAPAKKTKSSQKGGKEGQVSKANKASPDASEAKARLSRKSAAYHKARKAALDKGCSAEEAKKAGAEEPYLHHVWHASLVWKSILLLHVCGI